MNSSSSEKKKNQLINESSFHLRHFVTISSTGSSQWTKMIKPIVSTAEGYHSDSHVHRSSPRAHQWAAVCRLADTLEISAVTKCKQHRRTKTLQLLTIPAPVRILLALYRVRLQGKRIHPHPGQVERWKVEIGFRQRWVAARCSTAQRSAAPPLHSTPLPWEANRPIYCNIHNRCEH